MTKKIFYEKQGRKYVPVAEYDSDFLDSFPKGNHLVMCYPGGVSRRFRIDPALAPMIAAGRYAEDAICRAISKASELRPQASPLTQTQKAAWEKLKEAFGDEISTLRGLSIHDCAEAGVKAMMDEADKLMRHESVRKAYDHFMLMCELTKEKRMDDIAKRMAELMEPIDQQILMCDDHSDMLMMACAMLQRSREIFDQVLGPSGRMKMFKDYAEKGKFNR